MKVNIDYPIHYSRQKAIKYIMHLDHKAVFRISNAATQDGLETS